MKKYTYPISAFLVLMLVSASVSLGQSREAGRFDNGKMWTFDNPPLDYFQEAYNFQPDDAWFEKARLGALRFATYCSASFVSPNGLVMTNHHCARESVVQVTQEGEKLVDNGFYARTLDEERPVDGLFVEQLIEIRDVSDEVNAALEGLDDDSQRAATRASTAEAIEARMNSEMGEDSGMRAQVIPFYNGALYSAYIFRRFDDVRLVTAPDLNTAKFGGDPDNFTFPRYSLDFSFFRVYENDAPYSPEYYFAFSDGGAADGDATFVIGNPGSTSRLETVSQLEYRRDFQEGAIVNLLRSRIDILTRHWDPDNDEQMANLASLNNSLKAYTGRLGGLENEILMDRRRDFEAEFAAAIQEDSELKENYGSLLDDIASVKAEQSEIAPLASVFFGFSPASSLTSNLLARGVFGGLYHIQKGFGVPEENLAGLKNQLIGITPNDPELDQELVAARIYDIISYLGPDDQLVMDIQSMIGGANDESNGEMGTMPSVGDMAVAENAAAYLMQNSVLADADAFSSLLDGDWVNSDDPAVKLGRSIANAYIQLQQSLGGLNAQEEELSNQVALARFGVYGLTNPPDATFSLRIADGKVQNYEYNGTLAPTFTTFFGMLDRHYSHKGKEDWALSSVWDKIPDSFDLSTPFNMISTNDIIGGNSGSPLLNEDLEVVGLVFDGNIESLPGEFIYVDDYNRTISVHSEAMVQTLDHIYDLDRIAKELRTGKLFRTEAEADEMMQE